MIARSPRTFRRAVDAYRFGGVRLETAALYELAVALDVRALAFEWSHEEMDETVQAVVGGGGGADFARLWELPGG